MREYYYSLLDNSESITVEPSGCAAFAGVVGFFGNEKAKEYCARYALDERKLTNATHIAWATGGSLLPDSIKNQYLNTYLKE